MDLPQDPKWDMAKTGLAGLIGQKENCKGCSGIQLKSRRCEETNVAVRSPCRCGSVCAWDKVKEGVSLGGGSAEQCKVQGEWARASPEVAGTLSEYLHSTVPKYIPLGKSGLCPRALCRKSRSEEVNPLWETRWPFSRRMVQPGL